MATNFYRFSGVNLGRLAADPTPAEAGDHYFNTSTLQVRWYDGTSWRQHANGALSNLNPSTAINADLRPNANLARNLGATSLAWNQLYAGQIMDSTGVQSFDVTNRVISDPSGQQAARFDTRILSGTGPTFSVDWENRNLYDGTNTVSLDYQLRQLLDSGGAITLDWENKFLVEPSTGQPSLEWENFALTQNGATVLTWGNPDIEFAKTIVPDNDNTYNLGASGLRLDTVFTNQISAGGGTIGFLGGADFQNLYQIINVVDPTNPQDAATKAYVDSMAGGGGANTTLSNLTSPTAINQDVLPDATNTRDLGSASFQWDVGHIGSLYRNGNERFNLTSGLLKDVSAVSAIDLDNRNLQDSSGNTRLNWTGSESVFTGTVRPSVTNSASMGTPSFQWLTVNAANFVSNDPGNASNLFVVQTANVSSSFPNTASAFLLSVYGTGGTARPLSIVTQNDSAANSNVTKFIEIITGNKTAGTGDSGPITLKTGTSAGGTRGQIVLDGSVINASSNRITSVANPTSAQDAATKAYVDLGPSYTLMATLPATPGFVTVASFPASQAGAFFEWAMIDTVDDSMYISQGSVTGGTTYAPSSTFGGGAVVVGPSVSPNMQAILNGSNIEIQFENGGANPVDVYMTPLRVVNITVP